MAGDELFGAGLRRSAAAAARSLEDNWERYVGLVERLEAHPENRAGADKTWVDRSARAWRGHFRRAVRLS